jgi:hypothetical protein
MNRSNELRQSICCAAGNGRTASRVLPRVLAAASLMAVLMTTGCPQQKDPMEAFNNANTNTPGQLTNPGAPAPAAEPSTALFVGVVLLIGGTVLRKRYHSSHS